MSILFYFLAVVFGVGQSAAAKGYHRHGGSGAAFNVIKAGTALLLFAVVLLVSGFSFSPAGIGFGIAYGLFMALSMYSGYLALCFGPMALSGLLVSFSVVLPIGYAALFCGEGLRPLQIPGLFCFAVAMFFASGIGKKTAGAGQTAPANQKKNRGKWVLAVAVTFTANGTCSILQKEYGLRGGNARPGEFMFFAMLICFAVFLPAALLRHFFGRQKEKLSRVGAALACTAGLSNACTNYATTALSGTETAAFLFPAVSVGTILLSLLTARLLFGEKIRPRHLLAFLFGASAVFLLRF